MNIYSERCQAPPPPPRPPISRARAGGGGRAPGLLKVELVPDCGRGGCCWVAAGTWRCLFGPCPCGDARICPAVCGLRRPGTGPGCEGTSVPLQELPAKSQYPQQQFKRSSGLFWKGFSVTSLVLAGFAARAALPALPHPRRPTPRTCW